MLRAEQAGNLAGNFTKLKTADQSMPWNDILIASIAIEVSKKGSLIFPSDQPPDAQVVAEGFAGDIAQFHG
jgi:hypothetical protein